MRQSSYFIYTLRETPAEAEIISHRLMLRAGMIKKTASGIYSYMPLGLRVLKKIENIIRKRMDESGAVELLMSSVQPAELWQKSGRWDYYGKELLRFKDRNNRSFAIGPTHEEVITDIAASVINSYKQLPVNLYQIQTKFRDEIRPRFGLMRGREFIMKDGYSFDIDEPGANISYQKMYDTYCKIFETLGLKYKVVEADSGSIGGNSSHEFMVLAKTGEDEIIYCSSCGYSANVEKAELAEAQKNNNEEPLEQKTVSTPGVHTAEEAANLLNVDIKKILKTMIVRFEKKNDNEIETNFVAVVVRGDHEVNILKLKNLRDADSVDLASAAEVMSITNAPIGSIGPIGLNIPVYADNAVKYAVNSIAGANKKEFHIINVTPGKDFDPIFADLRNAVSGDICPKCGGIYESTRGIEVGHIFKLGTKYSDVMNAKALNKEGKNITLQMGCYGIGVGRTAAAAIEQNNDEKGIIWPKAIAPFEAVIVPINMNDENVINISNKIYSELIKNNIDVIIDDRDERAGVKLNDAELIGYPLRISIGKKSLSENKIEAQIRRTGETIFINIDNYLKKIIDILDKIS